jgi:type I site-specific restriction endonuclease
VRVFHGTTVVATHARSLEPFERVIDPAHYARLWQTPSVALDISAAPLAGRDLADYDQRLVREVATARFLSQAENVLIFGAPGVGKTHLAIALGRAVVEAGHTVLFTSATALLADRLLHHSHTLMIQGERYRLRQKKKAGLLGNAAKH